MGRFICINSTVQVSYTLLNHFGGVMGRVKPKTIKQSLIGCNILDFSPRTTIPWLATRLARNVALKVFFKKFFTFWNALKFKMSGLVSERLTLLTFHPKNNSCQDRSKTFKDISIQKLISIIFKYILFMQFKCNYIKLSMIE